MRRRRGSAQLDPHIAGVRLKAPSLGPDRGKPLGLALGQSEVLPNPNLKAISFSHDETMHSD